MNHLQKTFLIFIFFKVEFVVWKINLHLWFQSCFHNCIFQVISSFFFGGQVWSKPLHLMNFFLLMHLHPFIWVSKKTNYKTLNWQLLHLKILILFIKCLNPLKTSTTLLLLRMCMFFIPKIRKRLLILMWPTNFKSLDSKNAISKTHFQ